MYRIIACDLDETLLDSAHAIPERNRKAIQKASDQGVWFVCSTGRPYNSVIDTLEELGLNKEGQYILSFNGGMITEAVTERVLHYEHLDFERARAIYDFARARHVPLHVYIRDHVYIIDCDEDEWNYIGGRMSNVNCDEPSLDFLEGQDIIKMLFVNRDKAVLEDLQKQMGPLCDGLDVSFSSNRYMEFNPQGVNKGAGLRQLAQALEVDMSQTIAIGDNINDLPMIQAAAIGAGVANSNPAILPDCQYVCTSDNDHGAVGEVIERFVLNQADQD